MSKKSFCVLDFGTVAGTDAVQTEAFQTALDACFAAGGGEVTVPGGCYTIGDIRIRSHTVLHLLEGACIRGSQDPADYLHFNSDPVEPLPEAQNTLAHWVHPKDWIAMGGGFKQYIYTAGSYWNYGLIRAAFAENIGIIGEKDARIEGGNVYDPEGEEHYRGPHAINMHFCKNVLLRGYTVEHASNWGHAIFQSENVTFEGLTVLAGHDALHTRACSNVRIVGCTLMTGDDAIAGFDNLDVVIRDCEISSACSAFRFGGNDILVENCHVHGPCRYPFRGSLTKEEKAAGLTTSPNARNNMLSFWTNFVTDDLPPRRPAGRVVIRGCRVENADRMLHINLSGNEPWQRGTPPTDILFEDIKLENVKLGLTAYGIAGAPMRLTLRNVEYSYAAGCEEAPMLRVGHCDEVALEHVTVRGYRGDALIRAYTDGTAVKTNDLDCDLGDGVLCLRDEGEFVCKPI